MNKFIDQLKSDIWAILFFGLASVVILWQMLLPGYILTLDMIFTPEARVYVEPGVIQNSLPVKITILALSFIFPVWLIQKFIIFGLFFLMGFLAYKFMPVPKNYSVPYWAGIFYMANPFTYERFLAGHWLILTAYSLLPLFIYLLINFFDSPIKLNGIKLFATLFLISIFSLHLFVIGVLILIAFSAVKISIKDFRSIKLIIQGSGLILIFSLYWIVPFVLNFSQANINNFSHANWEVFATASDKNLGTIFNVLSLYGFWAEDLPWASYFIWPKDNIIFWTSSFFLMMVLLILGSVKSYKQDNKQFKLFLSLIFAGLIFSAGAGESIFKVFNEFLFNHVWFWKGFRDTQKWTAIIILGYAYFGSLGVYTILNNLQSKLKGDKLKIITLILFLIPVLYTHTIWGGFARQLKAVWYPSSWHEINEVLKQDTSDYFVLYLPWHQYLSLDFNQRLITQNPAKEFFGPKIIQGDNIELGSIYSQEGSHLNKQVENILLNFGDGQDKVLLELAKFSIKYIIYDNSFDFSSEELIRFDPVESKNLNIIKVSEDLTLLKVLL